MARGMYEMNLVIRLQDRASARMRRIAGDMSAMSRHAQAQNRLIQTQSQFDRARMQRTKAMRALDDMTNINSQKYNETLAKRLTLEKQLMTQQAMLAKGTRGRTAISTARQEKWLNAPVAVREQMAANLTKSQLAGLKGIEITRARQVALEAQITREYEQQNRALGFSNAQVKALTAQMKEEEAVTARTAKAAKGYRAGQTATHIGSLAFMGGAVGLGVLGAASKSYADFDVKATRAATQFGDTSNGLAETQKQAKNLEAAILGMGKQFPATATEMADASYDIFSSMKLAGDATQQFKSGLSLLRTANKAAVGGQIDLAEATSVMITVLNNFDPNLKHIDSNMAQLFATVRYMRGGFGDLGDAMNKIAPAAKNADQSLLQVGAAIAVVTRHMPSQSQAGTAISRLLEVFGRPDFINGMKKAGNEFDIVNRKTGKLRPLSEILDRIVKLEPRLQGGGIKLGNLIQTITRYGSETGKGGTQATVFSRRALTLLVTGHKEHMKVLKDATRDTREFNKSVAALSETAGVKWKTAMNNLRVAWIQVGQAAMPVMLGIADTLVKVLNKWQGLSKGTRDTIIKFAAVASVLAVIGGAITSIGGGAIMLVNTLRLLNLTKLTSAAGMLKGISSLGGLLALSIIFKTAITGKAKAVDFLLSAAGGALLGARFGIPGAIAGGIIAPVTLLITEQYKNHPSRTKKFIRDANLGVAAYEYIWGDKKKREAAHKKQLNLELANKKKMEEALNAKTHGRDSWARERADISIRTLKKEGKSKLDEIMKQQKEQTAAEKKYTKELASWEKSFAKEKVRARQDALKQQKADIKNYAQFLQQMETTQRGINEGAMGDLFGGPLSKGPLFGAFNDINSTLMGFGLKPIKIPIEFILKDQQAALGNFNDWQGSLAKLSKQLGPKYQKLIIDLQKQGIQSLPMIESLTSATPAQRKKWANTWTEMNSAVETATKTDMQRIADLWKSYPAKVRVAIFSGVDEKTALNAANYESWVVGLIPQELAKTFADRYNESLKNYLEANPRPTMPKVTQPPSDKNKNKNKNRPKGTIPIIPTVGRTGDTWANDQLLAAIANEYKDNATAHGWDAYNIKLTGKPRAGSSSPPVGPGYRGLTGRTTTEQTPTVINNTHNYNGVDDKSVTIALKQQEFRLRHRGK